MSRHRKVQVSSIEGGVITKVLVEVYTSNGMHFLSVQAVRARPGSQQETSSLVVQHNTIEEALKRSDDGVFELGTRGYVVEFYEADASSAV